MLRLFKFLLIKTAIIKFFRERANQSPKNLPDKILNKSTHNELTQFESALTMIFSIKNSPR